VIGIDESANQIAHAIPKENVEYRCHEAEYLAFLEAKSVDLVIIATALHWFNVEKCFEQVKRVLKPKTGVLAVWTYRTSVLESPMADAIYQNFNRVQLLPYWPEKRWLVEDFYQSLLPLFPYSSTRREYILEWTHQMTIRNFLGMVESMTGPQKYRQQHGEAAYQEMMRLFGEELLQSYRNAKHISAKETGSSDLETMIAVLQPIRLYLMRNDLED
jgi:ubiquinone/menaquinone biosynthesis C-methylase UbiE